MGYYFTEDTDRFIVEFNSTDDQQKKHQLFNDGIRPAFEKLIENLLYVYSYFKVDDVDTLKRECLASLYEMLPKFDPTKGAKGFSYFNVIAKNWFIHKIRERTKRDRLESELGHDLDYEAFRNDPTLSVSPHEAEVEEREWWIQMFQAMDEWKDDLKKVDIQVLDAISFILRHTELVDLFNRKAAYIYIRNITGLTTKQIVSSLKRIRELYFEWKEEYEANGGY